MGRKGFTLIELLIVIAVLSILAVAVLSAINPVEQLRKGRDAARKSDSAEILNASERYLTTFSCWPWENVLAVGCTVVSDPAADPPDFETPIAAGSVDVTELLAREEVKTQFSTRASVVNEEMKISEAAGGIISVCFTPESASGRGGGLGPIRNDNNTAAGSCTGTYIPTDVNCNVCLPQ